MPEKRARALGRARTHTPRILNYIQLPDCRQLSLYKIREELPVIRPRSVNTMQHRFTNLAVHIRDALPRRFSELAVFDARLYIRIRCIDEPA
jgi:hypothetical protein